MAVPTPTAADLKARYPEFNGVADSLVDMVIGESIGQVDETWELADQQPAILAYAAHLLSMEGWPDRITDGYDAGTAGREMLSRKVGDVSVTFAQTSGSSASGLSAFLNGTPYGRRFLQLLKLNTPAIGLV